VALVHRRRTGWALAIVAATVAVAVLISYGLDEPLRRYVERRMNASLTGYTARIGGLSFHPAGLSLTLSDLVFIQQANPDPPIARIPRLDASVQWGALLSGRLVANFVITRPILYVDLQHFRKEAEDPEPVTRKGWQEAFASIYPLKINELKIVDGDVTYADAPRFEPLHVSRVNLTARDIRNVRATDEEYPSPIHLEAVVFETGTVRLDGRANFLAEPHPGARASIVLDRIDLDYFKAITNHYNVTVRQGLLSAAGLVEYAPAVKRLELEEATVSDVEVEYVYTQGQKGVPRKAAVKTTQATREVSNDPGIVLQAKELKVVGSKVTFLNRTTTPPYRAFLSKANLTVRNFSNHLADGATVANLTGAFMGSGTAAAEATFRPEHTGPDFDVRVRVENTDLRALNDILKAHGKFDVVGGRLAVYSEVSVQNGRVEGYVKPLFREVDVYDPEQDRQKGPFRALYEKGVEAAAKLLKNVPRREVATVASIAGPIEDPGANTLQVLAKLVQNAFVQAILPGFDREVRGR
jgi:hypothetical protein